MKGHEDIDRRSLLLHRIVSGKRQRDLALLDRPRAKISRWQKAHHDTPALGEWGHLLDTLEIGGIIKLLRSRSPRATRLRQSSPFVGLLTERERSMVLERYATGRA